MGRRSSVGHGTRRISSFEYETAPVSHRRAWLSINAGLLLALLVLSSWPAGVLAMQSERIAQLRQETVEMFYHGYDNYMNIAFPEDEVRYTRPHGGLTALHICCSDTLTSLSPAVKASVMYTLKSRCAESEQCGAQRRPGQLLLDTYRQFVYARHSCICTP